MSPTPSIADSAVKTQPAVMRWPMAALLALAAAVSFHLAYSFDSLGFLIVPYLACLLGLSRADSVRTAFYFGFGAGFLCALQASFFYNIFATAALALWSIMGFWTGLFVALAQLTRVRLGRVAACLLAPVLWTGLEYFRSELYYLRFSWLNVGYVFAPHFGWLPVHLLGMYGIGFCLMAAMAWSGLLPSRFRLVARLAVVAAVAALTILPAPAPKRAASLPGELPIAGVQLEFPSELQVLAALNQLRTNEPDAQLLVLSEYTFTGPLPASVTNWCRHNRKYLVVGGEDPVARGQYRDTAFVIGPDGNEVFRQAKSIPIQFFKDGLPAESQAVWNSPWGKIGICICYDLSYTRVTDRLIRLGAQAIIVPSMDVIDWGLHQHRLHGRVAPMRAAEYSVPIFRLASSGISQSVDARGVVSASAPAPGDGALISSVLNPANAAALPWDRVLAPCCVVVDTLLILWLAVAAYAGRVAKMSAATQPLP